MMVSVVFLIFIMLAIVSGLVAPTVRHFKTANDLLRSKQSFAVSESGLEDVYYRLLSNKTYSSPETLTMGDFTATTSVEDSGYNQKTLVSLGDVGSRQRRNKLILNTGDGISFSYGVQIGIGGLTMGNGSKIEGSAYSNGNIASTGGTVNITGTAAAATTPA